MTPKEQYNLALSSIRHLRRINRYRAWWSRSEDTKWCANVLIGHQQEILRYSVEQHIMSAAVTTIISMKFNDCRFMSNRVLEGWIVKTTCSVID